MPGATFNMADAFAAFGVRVANGAMNATGTNPRILTSATAAFTIHDVGKKIRVAGAGASGGNLDTYIAKRISATQVELKAPALTTVAGANVSYVKGVYRLSTLLAGPDVDGNTYQVGPTTRRLQVQLADNSPGGNLFIGGPFVTTTNYGIQVQGGGSDGFAPGTLPSAMTTSDYLTSETANQKVNVYWIDDFNQATPA